MDSLCYSVVARGALKIEFVVGACAQNGTAAERRTCEGSRISSNDGINPLPFNRYTIPMSVKTNTVSCPEGNRGVKVPPKTDELVSVQSVPFSFISSSLINHNVLYISVRIYHFRYASLFIHQTIYLYE